MPLLFNEHSLHICEVDISVGPHSIKKQFLYILKFLIALEIMSGTESKFTACDLF
jgi:hypothetical protein